MPARCLSIWSLGDRAARQPNAVAQEVQPESADNYGHAAAISGDAMTLAVGLPSGGDGMASVTVRPSLGWVGPVPNRCYFFSPDTVLDNFGNSVAISQDGAG